MEDTIDNSQPIELYEFIGSYQTYRYTSDANAHTVDGNLYTQVAGLESTSLKIGTQDDDRDEIAISMPVSVQVAADNAFQTTDPSLEVVLRKYDRSGGSSTLFWRGPVSSISVSKHMATFKCPSKFGNALQSRIPTIMVQPQCNNVLYDNICGVSRAANSVSTTVTAINGRTITLASSGAFADSHFVGGELIITSTGERRTIVGKSGNVVTVAFQIGKLSIGNAVEIAAGCDHGWATPNGCTKFNNHINYTGCPFTPGEQNNVFQVGLN